MLPDQPGPYPHELIVTGKQGTIYVLNRDNMGQFCSSCTTTDSQIIQELPNAVGTWPGTPVFWNGTVYFDGGSNLSAYTLSNGVLLTSPKTLHFNGGGHALITSNGMAGAVYWSIGSGVLQAIDPMTLKILYTSNQAPNQRDVLPPLAHFAGPIEARCDYRSGCRSIFRESVRWSERYLQ